MINKNETNRVASVEILTEYSQSHAVAKMIADSVPSAYFCTFTIADGRKIPHNKHGQGVSEATPLDMLFSADEVLAMDTPSRYIGLVMHRPISDHGDVLFVLDVDTKHSDAPTDIAIQSLGKRAKDHELLTERSVSGRGRHVFGFAKPDETILPKYNLGNRQEVEVFGMPKSPKKSVLLTGDMLTMEHLGGNPVNLHDLLDEVGIIKRHHDAFPPKPAPALIPKAYERSFDEDYSRAADAISYIDPDVDYNDWIALGQALQAGLGDAGFQIWDEWSSAGGKYSGTNDLEYHWRSFTPTKGVTIATVFGMAKAAGYVPPTRQQKTMSAVEAFQIPNPSSYPSLNQPDAPQDSAAVPKPSVELGWPEHRLDLTKLQPTRYLIEGFLAHSFMILAGMAAVGKTSGLISLCLTIAGFKLEGSDLITKRPRKIIYVTEDMHQVQQILFAMCKHMDLDQQLVSDAFIMMEAKRSEVDELLLLSHNVVRHTVNGNRPFIILDTANATLALENENDNSEAGSYISALKQTIYVQLDTPMAIIAHTPKAYSKTDEDASARGASAFVGDVTLTSIMYIDDQDNRVMKLQKTRYEPAFREVIFTSTLIEEPVLDDLNEIQTVRCRISIPHSLSIEAKANSSIQKQLDQDLEKIDKACVHITDTINKFGPVAIKMGSGGAKNPPKEIAGLHRMVWNDVYANVPGASKSADTRRAVRNGAYERFEMEPHEGWCVLRMRQNLMASAGQEGAGVDYDV